MKIQLLYFPGCPNVDATRAALRRCLAGFGLPPTVEEIDVTAADTPAHLRGWGSPTILVDGVDVGGESAGTGAACRLYAPSRDPNGRGFPPDAMIRNALERAKTSEERR